MTRRMRVAACCAVGLTLEAYALVWMPNGRVRARGTHPLLLTEFGSGVPIAQGFTMQVDGLDDLRIQHSASSRADVDVEYRLSLVTGDRSTLLYSSSRTIHDLDGVRW